MKPEENSPSQRTSPDRLSPDRMSPDKSLSKIWVEMDDFKINDSESFLEDAKQLDGIINQANLAARQRGKVDTYVELDADYFEPFMKTEAVERLNTPSRICLKIIDKLLEEPDTSPTSLATAFKANNIGFSESSKLPHFNRIEEIIKSDRNGRKKALTNTEKGSGHAMTMPDENWTKSQKSPVSSKASKEFLTVPFF